MATVQTIKTLFFDLGGVLLTNGWDRSMRQRAASTFHLDYADMDERRHLTFDTFESGKLTLDEYLDRTIFYQDLDKLSGYPDRPPRKPDRSGLL